MSDGLQLKLTILSLVAIAWVMQKVPYVFLIVGGRTVEHLEANLEALKIALSPEQIKFLEGAVPFDKGFPYNFIVSVISVLLRVISPRAFICRATSKTTVPFRLLRRLSRSGPFLKRFAQLDSRIYLVVRFL